jgi:hypothetical protein
MLLDCKPDPRRAHFARTGLLPLSGWAWRIARMRRLGRAAR